MNEETGEYIEQEYEVIQPGGKIVTRCDGIGEHFTPISRMVARLYAAWGNGVLPATGGMFRQPARAMRLVEYFGSSKARHEDRRRQRTAR